MKKGQPLFDPNDYDELAVTQVVDDGHTIELKRADKHEAIKRMAAKRFTIQEMADRLMCSFYSVQRICQTRKIKIFRHPRDWDD
jgi:hypothetical protein